MKQALKIPKPPDMPPGRAFSGSGSPLGLVPAQLPDPTFVEGRFYVPSTYRRCAAWFMDGAIAVGTLLLINVLIILFNLLMKQPLVPLIEPWFLNAGASPTRAATDIICWVILSLAHAAFYTRYGATPGKMLMGLRVINSRTQKIPSFWQGFLRVGTFSAGFLCVPMFAISFFNAERRTFVDLMFRTRVVQKFSRRTTPGRRWLLGSFLILFFLIVITFFPDVISFLPFSSSNSRTIPKKTAISQTQHYKQSFENLPPEQQEFVRAQHEIAFNAFKDGDYNKTIIEVQKIFPVVSGNYIWSKELLALAQELDARSPHPNGTSNLASPPAGLRYEQTIDLDKILKPEQQRFIELQHGIAFDYFRKREFRQALTEIQKIFILVDDYQDAREIEKYSIEGILKAGGHAQAASQNRVVIPYKRRTFEILNPQQQQYVAAQREIALEAFKNRDYEKTVSEIEKIFPYVEDYRSTSALRYFASVSMHLRSKENPKAARPDSAP